MFRVRIRPKALRQIKSGHLWVFQNDVIDRKEELNGEVVRVESSERDFIGWGFYSYHSRIALRLISFEENVPEREFYKKKIKKALERRKGKIQPKKAVRLINAEGDRFPGLIADWYDEQIVIQCLVPATDRLKAVIAEILWEQLKPKGIRFRNDARARELENLALEKFFWKGEDKSLVEIEEGEVKFLVDLNEGHKTGAYLDQAENRLKAEQFCGARALDAFSYQGGFALHLAKNFQEVLAIESSPTIIEMLEKNLDINQVKNVSVLRGNVFEILDSWQKKEQFDLIVLDPPPFARSKKDLPSAKKGYLELNKKALNLLGSGGKLITYSCSFNFLLKDLIETIKQALAEVKRSATLLEIQMQAKDHPALIGVPESWYLKGLVIEVD